MTQAPARLPGRDWLEAEYAGMRRFARQIARELGCSTTAVTNALKRQGSL
jgi:hypothetical protein